MAKLIRRAVKALMMCILPLAFYCPNSFALNPDWQIHQYGHRAWKIEDGFLGDLVNAIAQDGDGYLWIGTNNGLFRFDGVNLTRWEPRDGSQAPAMILSLLADRDGSLWIGTNDGLVHLKHRGLTRYKSGHGVLIDSIVQDEAGKIWFHPFQFSNDSDDLLCSVAGSESIARWSGGPAEIHSPEALKNNQNQMGARTLAPDQDGSVLVGISKQGPGLGLQRFWNGVWTTVSAEGFDGTKHQVLSVFVDRHHAVWIVRNRWLWILDL